MANDMSTNDINTRACVFETACVTHVNCMCYSCELHEVESVNLYIFRLLTEIRDDQRHSQQYVD